MIISNFFINLYIKNINEMFTREELERITYSLQSIFWELEKILYISILFTFENKLPLFLMTFLILMSIRINSDGYHVESSLLCLVVSYLMFYLSINILPLYIDVDKNNILLFMLFCIVTTILLAPVDPEMQNQFIRKLLSIFITIFWFIIIFVNLDKPFAHSGFWIIIIQNIQLIVEYARRKLVSMKT